MALGYIHSGITKFVLAEAGFSAAAQDFAANENVRVDDQQGGSAAEANLHAMLGKSHGQIQTETQARKMVEAMLERSRKQIVDILTKPEPQRPAIGGAAPDYRTALQILGRALHTVQDCLYHRFEPWPYNSLTDSVLGSPNYMVCHVLRDASVVAGDCYQPKYDIKSTLLKLAKRELKALSGQASMVDTTVIGWAVLGPVGMAPAAIGIAQHLWNARPGGVRPLSARASADSLAGVIGYKINENSGLGAQTLVEAYSASLHFVGETRTAAGTGWRRFLAYSPP